MAGEWKEVTLAEVARITSGKRPNIVLKASSEACAVPVIGGGGPSGFTDAALYDAGVLVTGRVGTLGKLFVASEPCWPSDNALVVQPRDESTDSDYLRYALQTVIAEAAGMNRGAANPLITQGDLGRLSIGLPSLPEQRAVGRILRTLDDKIALNRRMSATLEAIARALFRSWFVDFEPVRAKAEGRDPGLPPHLAALFPDRLVETEHGENPEGWDRLPFGALLESSIGGDWGKEATDGNHTELVAIIRGTDIPSLRDGGLGKIPMRYVDAKKLSKRSLKTGDIVIEVSGGSPTQPTGRSLYITRSHLDRFMTPVVPASFCRRFRPVNLEAGALLYSHLDYLYESGGTWEYQNQSTGISNFQTTHFLESEHVLVPGRHLLSAFLDQAQPIFDRVHSNEMMALERLRDELLPKLVSGDLRVKDAETFLERVL